MLNPAQDPWVDEKIRDFATIGTGNKDTQDRSSSGQYPFFVRSQKIERIDTWSFDGEAVLTAGDGVGTGKVFHYIDGKFDYHQRVYKISDFRKDVSGKYFYYQFKKNFLARIESLTAKSSVDSVRMESIANMRIALPSLDEQERIVRALDDAAKVISILKQLIVKKQALKQGMIQQLLTGRTRLPGFNEAWNYVNFESITTLVSDRVMPQTVQKDLPLIELEHVEPSTGRLSNSSFASSATSLKARFRPGDVLFGKLRSYLRKYWLADRDGLCSTEFWVFRPKATFTSSYLRYLVESERFINGASNAYGTHMPRADWRVVRELEFSVPPSAEQKAIGKVLKDIDDEIAVLRARLQKAEDVKTGMMQLLLTGRVRLPAGVVV